MAWHDFGIEQIRHAIKILGLQKNKFLKKGGHHNGQDSEIYRFFQSG